MCTRLQDNNLKLKATKCKFLKSQDPYLGYAVSDAGIQMNPEKLDVLACPQECEGGSLLPGLNWILSSFCKELYVYCKTSK